METAALTLGRGTDQHVHVPDARVALRHARLLAAGPGRFQLEVLSDIGIVVNGRRQQDCRIAVGDEIRLGASRVMIEPAPAGFDLAVAVRRQGGAEDGARQLDEKTLHRRAPAIRLMSWLLFLLVLGIGLVDPLVSHFAPEKRGLMAALRLPGSGIWLPGPLSAPHAYFGHDCANCHRKPFRPVADEQCTACHNDVSLHLPGRPEGIADPAARRCEGCHLEHEGPDRLVMDAQGFCADCHRDTSAFSGRPSPAGAATDFGLQHPPFRVTLTRFAASGLESVRLLLDEARDAEASNLIFPHDVHMDPAGIEAPQGTVVMACEDCHREQPGGGLMASISFDAHCGACHRLAFDLSAPDRQVPHGDPQAALDLLVDFYAQLALRGSSAEVPVAVLESATPDRALKWARKEARRAAIDLFEDRACMQCHAVERLESGQMIGWTIPPVHLNRSWLPAARFSHRDHRVSECGDCHEAGGSSSSNDLLLPGIETCRECHGGQGSGDTLDSTCVDCHRFHHPERTPLHTATSEHRASLSLEALPDREAEGRSLRGMDPRRKRPGDGR